MVKAHKGSGIGHFMSWLSSDFLSHEALMFTEFLVVYENEFCRTRDSQNQRVAIKVVQPPASNNDCFFIVSWSHRLDVLRIASKGPSNHSVGTQCVTYRQTISNLTFSPRDTSR